MKKETYHKKKEEKMNKARQRIKKMSNFQSQDRRIEPISEDHKYLYLHSHTYYHICINTEIVISVNWHCNKSLRRKLY